MKGCLKFLAVLVFLGLAGTAAGVGWAWWNLRTVHGGNEPRTFEIEPGQGASAILAHLAEAELIGDVRLVRAYLIYALGDPPLIAGEYTFDRPMTAPQVLDKLVRGEIRTYPVTLIEGLDLDETAEALAAQGFGDLEALRREVRRAELINDLDPQAENLEGYLYPDTYHFARGTSEEQIVATLVATFRKRWSAEVEPLLAAIPGTERGVREIITLASIVEKEVLLDEERPVVAGVYAHRLRIGMALYADPTVIYGLKQLGTWDGNIRKSDLRLDMPYNTYVRPGLPPGPICSPAVKSLAAAADPPDTPYLYFVSKNDGSHVFSQRYSEHQRNVEKWQRQYWRRRWAEERRARE